MTHKIAFSTKDFVARDSTDQEYLMILQGLRRQYVLYYRDFQRYGSDFKAYGMPENESKFEADSVTYFQSYERFFKQDYRLIDWFLKFKSDTTNGRLWQEYHNPLSSYISECNLHLNNSRAAINLLENFLAGSGFDCYECPMGDLPCNMEQYQEVEEFLRMNNTKNIDSLRREWRTRGMDSIVRKAVD